MLALHFPSVPSLPLTVPFQFPCLPPSLCLSPSLSLGPPLCPQWKPQVHLGFLKSLPQDGFVGIVTAAKPVAVSVSVCLSLISGGPFGAYCILLYLVGMCVWGAGYPHGVCRYLQKLLPK